MLSPAEPGFQQENNKNQAGEDPSSQETSDRATGKSESLYVSVGRDSGIIAEGVSKKERVRNPIRTSVASAGRPSRFYIHYLTTPTIPSSYCTATKGA